MKICDRINNTVRCNIQWCRLMRIYFRCTMTNMRRGVSGKETRRTCLVCQLIRQSATRTRVSDKAQSAAYIRLAPPPLPQKKENIPELVDIRMHMIDSVVAVRWCTGTTYAYIYHQEDECRHRRIVIISNRTTNALLSPLICKHVMLSAVRARIHVSIATHPSFAYRWLLMMTKRQQWHTPSRWHIIDRAIMWNTN